MKNIVIIEDNTEVELFLRSIIAPAKNYHISASYNNCEEAIQHLKQDIPDIILMDIDLPGMNGIEGTKEIKIRLPKTDIIIVTVFENSEHVFAALCAGATGYLTKNLTGTDLLHALDECVSGGAPMSMKIAKLVVNSFKRNLKSPLSERETEILTLLAGGKSYQSIAEHLSISRDTVKFHIKNIYLKLQVNNKEEAIEIAKKEKLI